MIFLYVLNLETQTFVLQRITNEFHSPYLSEHPIGFSCLMKYALLVCSQKKSNRIFIKNIRVLTFQLSLNAVKYYQNILISHGPSKDTARLLIILYHSILGVTHILFFNATSLSLKDDYSTIYVIPTSPVSRLIQRSSFHNLRCLCFQQISIDE
jgi:hypothetical protein